MKTKFNRCIFALLIAILASTNIFQTSLAEGSFQPASTGKENSLAMAINLMPSQAYTPPELCPTAGVAPIAELFFDDLENGDVNWDFEASPSPDGAPPYISNWVIDSTGISSPTHSLFGPGLSLSNDSYAAMSVGVDISSTALSYLYFNHQFDFEADGSTGFDGGVLEYSTNGGPWQDAQQLFSAGQNYNTTLSSGNFNNSLKGRPAFSSTSDGMVASRYVLSKLGEASVRFRWRIGTDYAIVSNGWYVDDIRIYTCPAVTISGNAGVAGATLTYENGTQTATADGSGDYSFIVPYGWSGTVTPSKTAYTFLPANRTYADLLTDQIDQDYLAVATTYRIYLPLVVR